MIVFVEPFALKGDPDSAKDFGYLSLTGRAAGFSSRAAFSFTGALFE
jgi:hypothetical protein